MRKPFLLFFLVFFNFICYSEVQSPVIFALKIKEKVIIDGFLDEKCWKDAIKINHFLDIYNNSKLAQPQTYFQVIYDEKNVYFGITGLEPKISNIIKEPFPRDTWPKGTSIEIFLDTNNDRATYYQFATNLGAGIFDSYNKDVKWNGNWKIATKVYNDRWTIEISVPFSDFGIEDIKVGTRWGLNICRNREGGLQYSSSWAAVGGDFHNPGKFNTLIFGEFDQWIEAEIKNYMNFKKDLFSFLKYKKEKKIEEKLERIDRLMKFIIKDTRIKNKKDIKQILPIYKQMQKIQVLCQEIKDELIVIKLINKIKEEEE